LQLSRFFISLIFGVLLLGYTSFGSSLTVEVTDGASLNTIGLNIQKVNGYLVWSAQNKYVFYNINDEINDDIQILAQQMLNEHEKQYQKLSLNKKPNFLAYPVLAKDEFETTEQFNLRVQKEKENVDIQNIQNKKNWESNVAQQKKIYQSALEYIENQFI